MFSPNCNNTQVITFSQKLHFLFTQIVKQLTSLELHINSPNCKFTNISLLEWIFVWMDLCLIGLVFKSFFFGMGIYLQCVLGLGMYLYLGGISFGLICISRCLVDLGTGIITGMDLCADKLCSPTHRLFLATCFA